MNHYRYRVRKDLIRAGYSSWFRKKILTFLDNLEVSSFKLKSVSPSLDPKEPWHVNAVLTIGNVPLMYSFQRKASPEDLFYRCVSRNVSIKSQDLRSFIQFLLDQKYQAIEQEIEDKINGRNPVVSRFKDLLTRTPNINQNLLFTLSQAVKGQKWSTIVGYKDLLDCLAGNSYSDSDLKQSYDLFMAERVEEL